MKAPNSLLQACNFPLDSDGNKTIDEAALIRLKRELDYVESVIRHENLEEKRKKIIAEYSPHFPSGDYDSGWRYYHYKHESSSSSDHVYMVYDGRFFSADWSKFQKVSVVVRFYDREIKVECAFGRDYSPHPCRKIYFSLYDVTNPSELKARIISGIQETIEYSRDFLVNLQSNVAF